MSPFDRAHTTSSLTFHSNDGPISYTFRDRRRFQSKIANIFHPLVFCAPAEGVPLGTAYRHWGGGQKTRMMGLPGRQRSLASSTVWILYTNVADGRTETDTGRQQRPRLRIASRGKNVVVVPLYSGGVCQVRLFSRVILHKLCIIKINLCINKCQIVYL